MHLRCSAGTRPVDHPRRPGPELLGELHAGRDDWSRRRHELPAGLRHARGTTAVLRHRHRRVSDCERTLQPGHEHADRPVLRHDRELAVTGGSVRAPLPARLPDGGRRRRPAGAPQRALGERELSVERLFQGGAPDDPCTDGNDGDLFNGDGNEPPPDLDYSSNTTWVWGHFVKDVTPAPFTSGGSGVLCEPQASFMPCVAVLVE